MSEEIVIRRIKNGYILTDSSGKETFSNDTEGLAKAIANSFVVSSEVFGFR